MPNSLSLSTLLFCKVEISNGFFHGCYYLFFVSYFEIVGFMISIVSPQKNRQNNTEAHLLSNEIPTEQANSGFNENAQRLGCPLAPRYFLKDGLL